jgi:hypothetical protein
MAKRASFRSN